MRENNSINLMIFTIDYNFQETFEKKICFYTIVLVSVIYKEVKFDLGSYHFSISVVS